MTHGTESAYCRGCHCEKCKAAATEARNRRRKGKAVCENCGGPRSADSARLCRACYLGNVTRGRSLRRRPAPKFEKPELLTSVRIADVRHARYPSATKTLCGLAAPGFAKGRKWPPDCGSCSRIARRFHRIDGSMPKHWLPDEAAA